MKKEAVVDFKIRTTGSSFVLLYGVTDKAKKWMDCNLGQKEEAIWFEGGRVVENRFMRDIIDNGFKEDELTWRVVQ